MTPDQIQALRAAAEAATGGEWPWLTADSLADVIATSAQKEFVGLASPTNVLALIAECEKTLAIAAEIEAAALRLSWVLAEVRPDARPLAEYHEDMHGVVWWFFPVCEAPWIGSPYDSGWPGYHTHFTPLPPAPKDPTP